MQNRLTTVTRWTLSSGTSQDYKFLCLLIYLIQKSILNTLLLYSPTITLVWIPIWASFLWLIDDSYLKLEVKYWNNTRCLADLKNGTKLGCEKAEIILMAQSDRETEIFRLLPKYDSIPTTSSPGVTFHILNSWYNEDPNQSKWILTERKHPLGPYIKPNISPAPVPVHPKKLQRIKNPIDLIGAMCNWQYTITILSEESESAIKELGKCVQDEQISTNWKK